MPDDLVVNDRFVIPGAELEFSYSRAGGPGGQHVNTSDTRVRLVWTLSESRVLPAGAVERLRANHPSWLHGPGDIQLTVSTHRSRKRNVDEARRRLAAAIREALVPPRRRRATKPSRAVHRRRLATKKARGQLKQSRGKVRED